MPKAWRSPLGRRSEPERQIDGILGRSDPFDPVALDTPPGLDDHHRPAEHSGERDL